MTGKELIKFIKKNKIQDKDINIGIVIDVGFSYWDVKSIENDENNNCIAINCEDLSRYFENKKFKLEDTNILDFNHDEEI